MSLDASLKTGGGLIRHRNVLTRAERLQRMLDTGRVASADEAGVLGMPKTSNRKVAIAKKTPKKPEAVDDKKGKKAKK